jgi:hypothetical protein
MSPKNNRPVSETEAQAILARLRATIAIAGPRAMPSATGCRSGRRRDDDRHGSQLTVDRTADGSRANRLRACPGG